MKWGIYAGFFGLSMIKFLFTPFGGVKAGLSFIETYMVCVAGAIISAAIFYYSSEFFMIRAHKKRKEMIRYSVEHGIPLKFKKRFTRINKLVVNMKRRLGIIGISMYAPFFLSVPLGSIIAAKFYGKDRRTFPLIVFGMIVNGAITTGITYGSAYLL